MSGPVLGGTTITVNGTNLGKVVEDLVGGVTVAGVPCEVRQENYVASMRFVLYFLNMLVKIHIRTFCMKSCCVMQHLFMRGISEDLKGKMRFPKKIVLSFC